ncbi:MAG TPA: zinc-binding dehydrogenase [Baekduia sp.]|uniref:zinc-binding dehydrogenase n=1 Tax=Baekduia sp. TaxID=2600305 RepID=UPI002D799B4F|nr:zinc-binding dehydrogenase [Baekduia sp.]HET6507044.1 zinc-binding dehydrogenase [Baekduia sp.]
MRAVTLTSPSADDPVSAVTIGERDAPTPPEGWTTVTLKAASLNHHDVWNMRGVGVDPSWLPVVVGSDGAGVDADGNEVIVHPLIADPDAGGGDETLDPKRRMISDGIDGTFAEVVTVPRRNLVPKPAELSWEAAACLGTAWLTAYRMIFGRGDLPPGSTILVQGAGGGVATALIALGRAAGLRVWVTSRDAEKRRRAVEELGAHAAFESGARLPERVDAAMDTAGQATFKHSLRSLRPGGTLVSIGATTGVAVDPELTRLFLNQIRIQGVAMGTVDELRRLAQMCASAGVAPTIDSTHALSAARDGIRRMVDGDLFGKVVFDCAS